MLRCCYVSGWGWVEWGGIITFMWLAYIVRACFASRRERNGVPCLCTPVVSMECGKFPKVQYQVLGAHVKVVLWTLSYFKEFESGNGDGTVEIAQTSSISSATLQANAWRSETSRAEVKSEHPARSTKPCKNHAIPSKSLNFARQNIRWCWSKHVYSATAPEEFFEKVLNRQRGFPPTGIFMSNLLFQRLGFQNCWKEGACKHKFRRLSTCVGWTRNQRNTCAWDS